MTIEIRTKGLDKAINSMDTLPGDVDTVLNRVVKWGTLRVSRELRMLLSGRAVKARSGRFRSSLREFFPEPLVGGVGSDFVGARLREFGTAGLPGGVLTPKSAQYLAVPLPAAMTAAGVARSPREYSNTAVITSKLGNLLIVGASEEGEDIVPLFVLKKSVSQEPQRPFAIAEKITEPIIVREAAKQIRNMLSGKST
jgi:hypothetical protein